MNKAIQWENLTESGSRGCLTPSPHNTPHAGVHLALEPTAAGVRPR